MTLYTQTEIAFYKGASAQTSGKDNTIGCTRVAFTGQVQLELFDTRDFPFTLQ